MNFKTDRLNLRKLVIKDAPFILTLVNEPGWLDNIGNRNILSIEAAETYIRSGPQAMYERFGFGLLLIQDRSQIHSFGLSGLLQRDHLDAPDLGFALLASAEGNGYAFEASQAILKHEFSNNGRDRIWAFTKSQNLRSQKLLLKLNFEESKNDVEQNLTDLLYLNKGAAY
ncbi:MAG: ribosomal-protein-alanine N-acetyltransferase [Saprospiraceae bacterium]|jgi:ribosomal-protein-alanine N-acetyltransferase